MLNRHGITQTSELSTLNGHDLSRVHLAETTAGRVFQKFSDSAREARVTHYISEAFPTSVPSLLHADPHAGMLVTQTGGQTLNHVPDIEVWLQAVRQLAQFQQRADASALAQLGCPAYLLMQMSEEIQTFLADTAVSQDWGLEEDRISALQAARTRLAGVLTDLQALGLPNLPAHGDAHPQNALQGGQGTVWFDWSEVASDVHPFMDMGWFLTFAFHPSRANLPVRQAQPDLEQRISHAYLTALGCPEAALLLSQAVPMAMIHRAVVYDQQFRLWRGTIPGWRPNFVPYYLRNAARELKRL